MDGPSRVDRKPEPWTPTIRYRPGDNRYNNLVLAAQGVIGAVVGVALVVAYGGLWGAPLWVRNVLGTGALTYFAVFIYTMIRWFRWSRADLRADLAEMVELQAEWERLHAEWERRAGRGEHAEP